MSEITISDYLAYKDSLEFHPNSKVIGIHGRTYRVVKNEYRGLEQVNYTLYDEIRNYVGDLCDSSITRSTWIRLAGSERDYFISRYIFMSKRKAAKLILEMKSNPMRDYFYR